MQIDEKNEVLRKELATKLDIADIRLEIEKVRREVEQLRSETNSKIDRTKSDLVRWQIGIGIGLGTAMLTGFGILGGIMAKGFGWLAFSQGPKFQTHRSSSEGLFCLLWQGSRAHPARLRTPQRKTAQLPLCAPIQVIAGLIVALIANHWTK